MAGDIPGWQSDPTRPADHGRRPPSDVIADAFGLYRTRWRPILALSALVEGSITVATLPYLASRLEAASHLFFSVDPPGAVDATSAVVQGGIDGLASALPVAASLVLTMLLAVVVFAPEEPNPARHALGVLHRQWRTIAPPLVLIVLGWCAFNALASGAVWPLWSADSSMDPGRRGSLSLLILITTLSAEGGLLYLAVRWAVAGPILILNRFSLRTSLARSNALTHRRIGHVALVIIATVIVSGVASWLMITIPVLVLSAAGHDGALAGAIAATTYVLGRVIVGPIGPLVTAVLYRDLRDAGPASG